MPDSARSQKRYSYEYASLRTNDDSDRQPIVADARAGIQKSNMSVTIGDSLPAINSQTRRVLDRYFPVEAGSSPLGKAKDYLEGIMSVVIVLNCLQIGAECEWHDEGDPEHPIKKIFAWCDITFCVCYVLEISVKLCREGCHFFTDRRQRAWNMTDLSLTLMMMVEVFLKFFPVPKLHSALKGLRMLRVVRIIRIVRVLRKIPSLTVCVGGILGSLSTLFWIVMVLVILIYTFAIFFVMEVQHDDFENPADDAYADLFTAMMTLMDVVVLEKWTETLPPKQPILMVPFLMFVMLGAYGVTNVIIGVMVDATSEVKDTLDWESHYKQLAGLSALWESEYGKRGLMKENLALLDSEERERKVRERQAEMASVFEVILSQGFLDFPAGMTTQELALLFDQEGDGVVTHEEFTLNLGRLLLSDDFQARVVSLINQGTLKRNIVSNHEELRMRTCAIESRIVKLEDMMGAMQSDISLIKGKLV